MLMGVVVVVVVEEVVVVVTPVVLGLGLGHAVAGDGQRTLAHRVTDAGRRQRRRRRRRRVAGDGGP